MTNNSEIIYDFDIDQVKQVLFSGKKAVFDGLGKFWIETYQNNGVPVRHLEFEADQDLKNTIWEDLYYRYRKPKDKYTKIEDHLLMNKTIVFENFCSIYIHWDSPYDRWDDFRGRIHVEAKPRIKFLKDRNFSLN